MKLYYETNGGKDLEFICECKDTEEACKVIEDFWNPILTSKRGWGIHYIRIAEFPNYYWFDFGSHALFYRLYKDGKEPSE